MRNGAFLHHLQQQIEEVKARVAVQSRTYYHFTAAS
ncbi:hypothetical protein ALON55S_04974 [Alishewanella longhuensis]